MRSIGSMGCVFLLAGFIGCGVLSAGPVPGSSPDDISLPAPQKTGGMPLMEALNARRSSRAYADRPIPEQTLSNLLWAAFGINRPESGKRTAPSSENVLDILLYVATAEGVFLYLPEVHGLKKISDTDIRAITGKQEFVRNASVNLIYVTDLRKYKWDMKDESEKRNRAMGVARVNAGFIGQNVYLFCASEGLNTVFRGWIDADLIHETLNLDENHRVVFCQSVGYEPE